MKNLIAKFVACLAFLLLNSVSYANCSPSIDRLLQDTTIEYDLPYELLLAIANTESNCKPGAVNKKTHDYGLMQINAKTALAHGYTIAQIMNPKLNVQIAAQTLVFMRKRFKRKPKWECGYNVGTAKNALNWQSCHKYYVKLQNAGYIGSESLAINE